MTHDSYSDATIRSILEGIKTFAMVGASGNPVRPSYFTMKYLLAKGYGVIPVNPGHAGGDILGRKVYARLADIGEPVGAVDIFRNSEAALAVTEEAIAVKDKLGIKVIWMQLGVRNESAAALAEDAGLTVIMNRCPKIEYGRLSGEIGWSGVASNVLSSKRPRVLGGGFQQLSIGQKK